MFRSLPLALAWTLTVSSGLAARDLARLAALALLFLVAPASLRAADGDLDTRFGGDGIVTIPFDLGAFKSDLGTSVVELDGHRLLVAGSITLGDMATPRAFGAAQLTATAGVDGSFGGGDGRVDYTWGSSTWDLVAAARTSAGEILLAGSVQWSLTDLDFLVLRLMPDGTLDPRFGGGDGYVTIPFDVNPGGSIFDLASSLMVTPSGDILVAGTVQRAGANWDMAVARLTQSGALDPGFGEGSGKVVVAFDAGGFAGQDQALAIFPSGDGAIVLVGGCENGGLTNTDFAIALLDQGGHLVPGFGSGGKLVLPFDLVYDGKDYAYAGAADGRGRIYAAGRAQTSSGYTAAAVACVTWSGAACAGFGESGRVHFALATAPQDYEQLTGVAVDDLGRIVASGTAYAANRDVAVVRLLPSGALDTSFADTGVRVLDLDHGPGGDDDEAIGLTLVSGEPVVVGATEYNGVDDDFFVLRLFAGLVQADDFEGGTFAGWPDTP